MADKIFKRKIYSKMLDWKNNSNGETALLIQGARRVGKSTVALQFAENEYQNYILIDFSKDYNKTIFGGFLQNRQHRQYLQTL